MRTWDISISSRLLYLPATAPILVLSYAIFVQWSIIATHMQTTFPAHPFPSFQVLKLQFHML